MTAVRTGAGKSQASAYVNKFLRDRHLRTTVVRHPMPYGAPLAATPAFSAFRPKSEGVMWPGPAPLYEGQGLHTSFTPTGMHQHPLRQAWDN